LASEACPHSWLTLGLAGSAGSASGIRGASQRPAPEVTGYQVVGDKYRLQMGGGTVEIAAEDVVAIERKRFHAPAAKPMGRRPIVNWSKQRRRATRWMPTSSPAVIAVESTSIQKHCRPRMRAG